MNERLDSIVLAEQQVAEARTAVHNEYQVARATLRRRERLPIFIGGLLLGATALGYLALSRGKAKASRLPAKTGAWSRVGKTVQVLLPLLLAFNLATKTTHRPRTNISGTAG